MRTFSTKHALVGALVVGLVVMSSATAFAQDQDQFDATIDILENVAIEQIEAMNFGTVGKPTTDPATVTLGEDGSVSIAGDADAFVIDDGNAGIAQVTGNPADGVQVTFDSLDEDFNSDFLSFLSISLDGTELTEGGSVVVIPTDGQEDFNLGAEAEIEPDVEAGDYQATITLTADHP